MLHPAGPEYRVARGVVPPALVDGALRRLHVDLLERGASAEVLAGWLWGVDWFPHLKHDPAILALAAALPPDWQTGTLCDPQILLQFPHVGVALSRWRECNGGLLVRPAGDTVAVELDPGDAVLLTPDLPHSGGINRTGAVRYGVYFRWLDR
jgi:hypothetical protein